METDAFEMIVREAMDALPPRIREELGDIVILIEDRPTRGGKALLGIYEGVPLTAWGRAFSGKMPDTITLYRNVIEDVAESPEEIPHVIRETVWHEVGHHFGLDHRQIGEMERRWRQQRT